ncbi:MAG: aldo/keto reductase [Deltaproteobacteria bacterium]|nr:aldo/keto reductase [Deltaproteobacteria bacterium]
MSRYLEPRAPGAPPIVALGTMNFGKRTPEDEARRVMARASERDVRLFDTANVYGDGASERIVGRAVRELGLPVSIATKVGMMRLADSAGREGLAPERMLRALDESLSRLGVAAIDLWYLHAPDDAVPIDETIDAVGRALAAGKIRAWGMSNYASWEVLEARVVASRLGVAPPRVSQLLYNLLVRQLDVEWFEFARRHGVHTTVFNALAGGLLAGRHRRGEKPAKGSRFDGNKLYLDRYWSDRNFALVEAYAAIAARAGMPLADLAHAWVASAAGVDSILVGPGSLAHLDAALDACARALSPELRAEIDRLNVSATGTNARYARH